MIDDIDRWTRLIDAPLKTLTKIYPARTGIGAIGGLSVLWIGRIFDPIQAHVSGLSIGNLSEFQWALIGVFVAHIPTLVDSYRNPRTVSKKFNDSLALIDKGKFTLSERRAHIRRLLEAEFEKMRLPQELKPAIIEDSTKELPITRLSKDD